MSDLHEAVRVAAWIAVGVVVLMLLVASASHSGGNWDPDAYKPPKLTTYYQPLTCFDGEAQTLICQRPYVPNGGVVK